ncbi:MAG TPA: hypothetical protein VHW96_18975 [Solirubrobacteraceae bacterium]|nr:hypothetical protein [Solirubrobacteraceae bacterium]
MIGHALVNRPEREIPCQLLQFSVRDMSRVVVPMLAPMSTSQSTATWF